MKNMTTANNSAPVYRSLPTVQSPPQLVFGTAASAKPLLHTSGGCACPPRLPTPLASYPVGKCVYLHEVDVPAMEKKLKDEGVDVQGSRLDAYELCCKTEDALEFTINFWNVDGEIGALDKYMVEVTRNGGCPYALHELASRVMLNNPIVKRPAFRPPQLPDCLCDNGVGMKIECVEVAIQLALCDIEEQRVQACLALADLCVKPGFARLFTQAEGRLRIAPLAEDKNPVVRKAARRVMEVCV